jgi:hypothetical protein
MKYINLKSVYGVETIDELNPKDFSTFKDFRKELKRLIYEYHLAGMNVYSSQRSSKDWNK